MKRTPWYRQPEDSFAYKWGRFLTRAKTFPGRLWWAIRHRTTNRYHMLDLRHGGYRAGWMDVPQKMEAAVFACLVFFVEEEKAFDEKEGIVDWYDNKELQAVRGKALELYDWWTKGQYREAAFLGLITKDCPDPMNFVPIPGTDLLELKFTEHPRWDQYKYWSDRHDAKRKRMFQMLVDIREWLWV
jgi:hypothetical protein